MARLKSLMERLRHERGDRWVYYAVLHEGKVSCLYLRSADQSWWKIEEKMPGTTHKTHSPYRTWPDGKLAVVGPVSQFLSSLVPEEGKPALAEAIAVCSSLSLHSTGGSHA
jgi:hypothetical protein